MARPSDLNSPEAALRQLLRNSGAKQRNYDSKQDFLMDRSEEDRAITTARKRFELVAPALSRYFKAINEKKATHRGTERKPVGKQLRNAAAVFYRSITLAASAANLNPKDETERNWLLMQLAWSIYGKNPRGRKKQWNKRKLKTLLADFKKSQAKNPSLRGEEQICQRLVQKYELSASTLRRHLQDAKKLQA